MKKNIVCLSAFCILGYAFIFAVHPKTMAVPENRLSATDSAIRPFALLELYTSEGCSNCVRAYTVADAFFKAATVYHEQIYLLDFHVDYFNDPWVDPYSSPRNTARQESYKRFFPNAGVYTPQMVVNGGEVLLASSAKRADAAVTRALKITPAARITITYAAMVRDSSVEVRFTTGNIPPDSMIDIALVQQTIVQKILKGENAEKTLTHHNVVRSMIRIPAKDGTALIHLPHLSNDKNAVFSIIAFRQDLSTMKIVAAAEKDVKN